MIKLKKSIKSFFITLALCGCVVTTASCSDVKENDEYVDVENYLGIKQVEGNEGIAVIVNGQNIGNGIIVDGVSYLPYDGVREYIDSRYYWNDSEKMLTYASSKHIYDAYVGTKEYTLDGSSCEFEHKIVICAGEKAYINADYVLFINGSMKMTFSPHYILVENKPTEISAVVGKDTKLRENMANSYGIVSDLAKGKKVKIVLDETKPVDVESQADESAANGWVKVYEDDGLYGYVQISDLTDIKSENVTYSESWLVSEPYTYIAMDGKVCLGWHQMEYSGGNDSLHDMVSGADNLNVISPTWFKVVDEYGGISSLASSSYVDNANEMGIKVWGLINDFEADSDNNYYINSVVTSTNARRTLIKNIMEEASSCGMDGINIDFEQIRRVAAEGYIQFMRELAIECDKAGIVLSVDMYVPTGGNEYYDREALGEVVDYLIIMGYDEHWAGCGEAGSVASLPFVQNGIESTLKEVPAERLINAIPFYTRVWYEDELANAPEGATIVEDAINGDYALSSKAVGLDDAKDLIRDNNGSMVWLEDIGQYYSEYYIGERLARIWLEDKESLMLKLNVMKANNLAGVACWKLGLESEEAWEAIEEYMK